MLRNHSDYRVEVGPTVSTCMVKVTGLQLQRLMEVLCFFFHFLYPTFPCKLALKKILLDIGQLKEEHKGTLRCEGG